MKLFTSKKEKMTSEELKARIIARTESNNELKRQMSANAGNIGWMLEAIDAHSARKYNVNLK